MPNTIDLMPNVVMFPNKMGQTLDGVEHAPASIVASHNVCPSRQHPVWCDDNLFNNLQHLHDTNMRLLGEDQRRVKTAGVFPWSGKLINVGGDHSMSIATVSATLRAYPDAKVLWVDAHPDLNTYKASRTKSFHGMPLAYLAGLDWPFAQGQFPYITHENCLNLADRLMYVGIRDIDPYEARIISRYKIPFVTVHDMRTDPGGSIRKVLTWTRGSPLHLSFDVDSIDPGELPSTGTPVPDGLSTNEAKVIVDSLLLDTDNTRIVNVDLTELNMGIGHALDRARSLGNVSRVFANLFNPPGSRPHFRDSVIREFGNSGIQDSGIP